MSVVCEKKSENRKIIKNKKDKFFIVHGLSETRKPEKQRKQMSS
jgi:hypothetical protein